MIGKINNDIAMVNVTFDSVEKQEIERELIHMCTRFIKDILGSTEDFHQFSDSL